MDIKPIITADGSSSLYREDIDETYHSRHGSVQEALHVFIEMGLKKVAATKKKITILEVGFGTGLNCLLSAIAAERLDLNVEYIAIETIPLPLAMVEELSFMTINSEIYSKIHAAPWGAQQEIHTKFKLKKWKTSIQEAKLAKSAVDLIYYDAFGPRAQPEMWTPAIFKKMEHAMKPAGIFVTYCAKGQVRRDLKATGLQMERLPGPPGKREMLRGNKDIFNRCS